MRIPTREEHISMNLGQAVAVCLYELIRDPEKDRCLRTPAGKINPGERWRSGAVYEHPHRGAQPQRFFSIAARSPMPTTAFAAWFAA
jgi:hypothetical protein